MHQNEKMRRPKRLLTHLCGLSACFAIGLTAVAFTSVFADQQFQINTLPTTGQQAEETDSPGVWSSAGRHAERQGVAALQSQIRDLNDDVEVDEQAADNFDREAQVLQGPAGILAKGFASQKRQEVQRLNRKISDLEYQLQAAQSQAIARVGAPLEVNSTVDPASSIASEETEYKPCAHVPRLVRKVDPVCQDYCNAGGDCPVEKPQYPNDGVLVK